jgi:hypothetical protein
MARHNHPARSRSSSTRKPSGPPVDVRLWTLYEAAPKLGWSVETLRGKVARRQVPYLKVGAVIYFKAETLQRWIDEQTVQPTWTGDPRSQNAARP